MCGIFGIVSRPGRFSESQVLDALCSLSHRGPDDSGIQRVNIGEWEIWLGHNRLSIIDLSAQAHQPMYGQSAEGKHGWIVFNGETYNFNDLKKDLAKSWHFISNSDTEVLLAGLLTKGPELLKSVNGMLALGLLDCSEGILLLARDRLGKKPLYYYQGIDLLIFSSELKPFRRLGVTLTIDEEALTFYRWLGYIPSEMTIYKECMKLPAANFMRLDLKHSNLNLATLEQYWDPLIGYTRRFEGNYEEAIEEFLYLLDDATEIRLISDVPLGVFLSGGIDSSLVTSSVQKIRPGQVTAFTVKYEDSRFDESPIAIETARQLGIRNQLLNLESKDFQKQIVKIPFHYDEPLSDSSQIPTLAIAEAAREKVTVVLTGDGGDEVFLGYPRYSFFSKLNRVRKAFHSVPKAKDLVITLLNTEIGKRIFTTLLRLLGGNIRKVNSSINRINTILNASSHYQVYDAIMSVHQKPALAANDQADIKEWQLFNLVRDWYPNYSWEALEYRTIKEHFAAIDMVTFMRDDVLVKVDRATMAYSLEARSPLLDYRIIEFGTSLPLNYKSHHGVNKRILRDALSKRLKGNIKSLRKSGFDVPLPDNLPEGADPQTRWNIFVEEQWRHSIANS